ncbi:MAG TPA: hypothetical protein VE954_28505 [Oligoflexus sp.]|uniref:hypothetical protein n=1 Tax=Oligoflexus sp. TaxID=1971216 RepID=UPI002D6553E3|nr:hypothetical protein [Oligoflexus sp.]HYX37062.1 hypothetical protein [Oligoflexus sp.]
MDDKDPLAFRAGWNFYTYAGNDPVNHVAPDGRFAVPGAIVGAVSGGPGAYLISGGHTRT